jgi:hypothetical protein
MNGWDTNFVCHANTPLCLVTIVIIRVMDISSKVHLILPLFYHLFINFWLLLLIYSIDRMSVRSKRKSTAASSSSSSETRSKRRKTILSTEVQKQLLNYAYTSETEEMLNRGEFKLPSVQELTVLREEETNRILSGPKKSAFIQTACFLSRMVIQQTLEIHPSQTIIIKYEEINKQQKEFQIEDKFNKDTRAFREWFSWMALEACWRIEWNDHSLKIRFGPGPDPVIDSSANALLKIRDTLLGMDSTFSQNTKEIVEALENVQEALVAHDMKFAAIGETLKEIPSAFTRASSVDLIQTNLEIGVERMLGKTVKQEPGTHSHSHNTISNNSTSSSTSSLSIPSPATATVSSSGS